LADTLARLFIAGNPAGHTPGLLTHTAPLCLKTGNLARQSGLLS